MGVGFLFEQAGRKTEAAQILREGFNYNPSLGEEIAAGFSAGLQAEGSAREDRLAAELAREFGEEPTFIQRASEFLLGPISSREPEDSQKLTKEEYENSPYFREDIKYRDGMTVRAAKLLAEQSDIRRKRDFIFQQAGVLGKTAYGVSALAGSMADIKGLLAGAATGFAGAGIRGALGIKLATKAAKIGNIAGESVVGSLPSIIGGVQNEELTQSNYGVDDAMLDLFASAALGVGFHVVGEKVVGAIQTRIDRKRREAVARMVMSQLESGEFVNVREITQVHLADSPAVFTTVDLAADKPKIRKLKDGSFEATFDKELGIMQGVKARGKTELEAEQALLRKYGDEFEQVIPELGVKPEVANLTKQIYQVQQDIKKFKSDEGILEIAEREGLPVKGYRQALERVKKAEERVNKAAKEYRVWPNSSRVQAEMSNSTMRLREAKQKLNEVRNRPKVQQAVRIANRRAELLDEQLKDLRKRVRRAGLEGLDEQFIRYLKQQLDPEQEAARSSDPLARAVNIPETEAEAKRAPKDDGVPTTAELAEIEKQLEALPLSDSEREALMKELSSLNEREDLLKALEDYARCRGG